MSHRRGQGSTSFSFARRAQLVLAVLASMSMLVLTGCGDNGTTSVVGDQSPTSSPTTDASPAVAAPAAGLPRCAKVWRAGARIPGAYRGCVRSGTTVAADATSCSSGQSLVRYAHRFYAVKGGPVQHVGDLAHSNRYRTAWRACTG